jgi:hypothetical protein
MVLPDWRATKEHEPGRSKVTLAPVLAQLTLHTEGVVVEYLTLSPDEARARTASVEPARARLGSATNVIVWAALDTVKLRLTGAAGA